MSDSELPAIPGPDLALVLSSSPRAALPERLYDMAKTRCAARRVVTLCLLAAVFAVRASGEPLVRRVPVMPGNIRFARELQASVDAMLEVSPTFRGQFERIASAPRLIIDARTDMSVMQQSFRARSCIRRYDSGLVIVSM